MAQRLVRVLCEACKREMPTSPEWHGAFGTSASDLPAVWAPAGCDQCRGTGYQGRIGLYELLVVDDALRSALVSARTAGELRQLAIGSGMRTLLDDGLRHVQRGTTSGEEVLRVCRG